VFILCNLLIVEKSLDKIGYMGYAIYFCVTTLITCQKFMLCIWDGQLKQRLLIEFTDSTYIYSLGVDSASSRNEYQEYFLGG